MIRNGLNLFSTTKSMVRNVRQFSISTIKLAENDNVEYNEKNVEYKEKNVDQLFSTSKETEFNPNVRKHKAYSLNSIQLIGGVLQDPLLRSSRKSDEFSVFRVATNTNHRKNNGEVVEHTDFHEVIAFGRLGEFVRNNVKKGQRVYVSGRLSYVPYVGPNGDKYDKPNIVAEVVQYFGKRNQ